MAFKKGDLAEIFRKRRRGLTLGETLPLTLVHKHPYSGAQLIFAKSEIRPRPVEGPYVVGWLPSGDQTMWFYRRFETQQESLAFFRVQKRKGPPDHDEFKYDDQMNDVYGWEGGFRLKTQELTLSEMKKVVASLSDIFNIEAPDVSYKPGKKKKTYAEASLQDNEIIMYRPNLALLLHEFAHLINDQVNQDKWAWHGPGFVRTYLSVLSLFPDMLKERNFEKEAITAHIKIAREEDIPASRHVRDWVENHCAGKIPNLIPSAT